MSVGTFQGSKEALVKLIPEFLAGSSLIYTFATLRSIVRDHDPVIRSETPDVEDLRLWSPFAKERDSELVHFRRPELIITQSGAQKDRNRYLKYDITAAAVLKFIQENRDLLCDDNSREEIELKKSDGTVPLKMEATLESLLSLDIDLVEFDDRFEREELVYGITVNKTNKRTTVFFRGSVFGGKDWSTDFNGFFVTYPVPGILKNTLAGHKEIEMHRGFHSYLFAPNPKENGNSKFRRIVEDLKEIYAEYPDYALYVSGHSLGGALAQLLAFALASDESSKGFPLPIRAISFASPQVGNTIYSDAFAALEKAGRLRHIRVSNQGDLVPELPRGCGYAQTGLNLHVKPNETMSVSYRHPKTLCSQVKYLNFLSMHALDEYEKHILIPENQEILASSGDDLYDEFLPTSKN